MKDPGSTRSSPTSLEAPHPAQSPAARRAHELENHPPPSRFAVSSPPSIRADRVPYFLYCGPFTSRAGTSASDVVMDLDLRRQRVRRAPIVLVQTVIAVEEDDAVSGARAGGSALGRDGRGGGDGDVVIVRGRRRDVGARGGRGRLASDVGATRTRRGRCARGGRRGGRRTGDGGHASRCANATATAREY